MRAILHANECPHCEGRGYFERTRPGAGGFFAGHSHTVEIECAHCDGTGEIDDEPRATASESTVPMGRAAA